MQPLMDFIIENTNGLYPTITSNNLEVYDKRLREFVVLEKEKKFYKIYNKNNPSDYKKIDKDNYDLIIDVICDYL